MCGMSDYSLNNVLIAVDSFKGSLSTLQCGRAVEEGIRRVFPHINSVVVPIADGGEGTVKSLVYALNGKFIETSATDPVGRKIQCEYGIIKGNTAVVEIASAAGITLITEEERNPLYTSTYGVGEIIIDAIKKGCRDFIIGIGGSATNDGGVGMLQALGFGILDKNGNQISFGSSGLENVYDISCDNVLPELSKCTFRIACDVANPLCGPQGCSYVFGPQKGATDIMMEKMDGWLYKYSNIVRKHFPKSNRNAHGAGAAGGLGFAFMSFLNGKLESGIDLILREIQMEKLIKKTDIVITGEGRLDAQTVMGKAPIGIAGIAKKYSKPVIAFAGCVTDDAIVCNNNGIDAFFSIVKGVSTLEEAINKRNAYRNLSDTAEQVFRAIKVFKTD